MKFEEALAELRKGKSIKRECVDNFINIKQIYDHLLLIDILQDDWEVDEEPEKTFLEVSLGVKRK